MDAALSAQEVLKLGVEVVSNVVAFDVSEADLVEKVVLIEHCKGFLGGYLGY